MKKATRIIDGEIKGVDDGHGSRILEQLERLGGFPEATLMSSNTDHLRGEKTEDAPETKTSTSSTSKIPTIIERLAAFVKRFIFLERDSYYDLIALWIVATYLCQNFDYIGYLFVYSPERQSGKSKLLEILDLLVYQSSGLQVSPTQAVMFRTAEGRTHLLDEVDSWRNKDDLRDVLNAGFKKGGVITRCERGTGSFKPKTFPVFAPRALAGIGLKILHPTTLDRTFAMPMVRQKRSEKRERSRERVIGAEAKTLRQEIEAWVKINEKSVGEIYDSADFDYLNCFSDRTIDIAEPFAAIIEVVHNDEKTRELARKSLVDAIVTTRSEQQSASNDHLLLKHLLHLTETEDPLVGNPTELAGQCANLEGAVDSFTISRILRNYGFRPKSIRKGGEKPAYRYTLTRSALSDVVERWASEPASGAIEQEETTNSVVGVVSGQV